MTRFPAAIVAGWSAALAVTYALAALAAVQFPIFTDAFDSPHRPIVPVLSATLAAWVAQTSAEIGLALARPAQYPDYGAFTWLVSPAFEWLRGPTFRRYISTILFILPLSTFPAVVFLGATTIPEWLWIGIASFAATGHILAAVRQAQKWKVFDER
ncbi:hypothetical protein [Actinomadura rayongensis]|uniref:Uncharacterized protein n=1 Tax=Actinomadura rayongensis TaxID=1429076 RepID=A0A6I4W6U0_9ACTN|nr:hypothetical protein [Actinomadura rayongensis]MXQ65278.1 hypothetical protein [Actinomadura rayongensis]